MRISWLGNLITSSDFTYDQSLGDTTVLKSLVWNPFVTKPHVNQWQLKGVGAPIDTFGGFELTNMLVVAGSGVPEIDPAGMGSVLALVTGALGLVERRRLKAS